MKFNFGNIVVVEGNCVGVICKCWEDNTYEVYVRSFNNLASYKGDNIQPFIYDKEIEES